MKNEEILAKNREGKLADREHVIVICSNCHEPLVEIWVVRPAANVSSSVRADCPHCGDKSFAYPVVGGFLLGHCEKTLMVDTSYTIDQESGTQHVHVKTRAQ